MFDIRETEADWIFFNGSWSHQQFHSRQSEIICYPLQATVDKQADMFFKCNFKIDVWEVFFFVRNHNSSLFDSFFNVSLSLSFRPVLYF